MTDGLNETAAGPGLSGAGRKHVVVIGGGHAAGRLVERLRAFGFIGQIDIIGDESHLPYERPWLSKAMLCATDEPAQPGLFPSGFLDDPKTRHLGDRRATAIDLSAQTVSTDAGDLLRYDILVLSTGLAPRRLQLLDDAGIVCDPLQTLDQARTLRAAMGAGRPIALIGAGFIGLEVASSARAMGLAVHVIDVATQPLGRALPQILGATLADLHLAEGSQLHMGRRIIAADNGDMVRLHLDNDTTLEVGTIVLGMGGVPRDDLARAAGLRVDDGILVDATGLTSDPAVYAIGDVARQNLPDGGTERLESWRNAEDTATIAAAAITGHPPPSVQAAPWFWTDQLGRRIQILGRPCPNATLYQSSEAPLAPGYAAFFVQDDRLRQVVAVDAPRAIRAARGIFQKARAVMPEDLAALGLTPANANVPAEGLN